jgi:hypothetical protein
LTYFTPFSIGFQEVAAVKDTTHLNCIYSFRQVNHSPFRGSSNFPDFPRQVEDSYLEEQGGLDVDLGNAAATRV